MDPVSNHVLSTFARPITDTLRVYSTVMAEYGLNQTSIRKASTRREKDARAIYVWLSVNAMGRDKADLAQELHLSPGDVSRHIRKIDGAIETESSTFRLSIWRTIKQIHRRIDETSGMQPLESQRLSIDPGKTTGWAKLDRATNRLIRVSSGSIWDVVAMIPFVGEVYIEDSRHLPIFLPPGLADGVRLRKARDVGTNERDITVLAEYCVLRKVPCYLLPIDPKRRDKWSQKEFAEAYGWNEPSSQHARDAARIARRVVSESYLYTPETASPKARKKGPTK